MVLVHYIYWIVCSGHCLTLPYLAVVLAETTVAGQTLRGFHMFVYFCPGAVCLCMISVHGEFTFCDHL